MSVKLRKVLDEHFWHPPVPNPEHPMHRGGCYCGWQCKRIFGESRIDQYIDHLHGAIVAALDPKRAATEANFTKLRRSIEAFERLIGR